MLSDAKVRSAKPRQKPYKISDGHQLYLYVSTAGGKLWRMNYQFNEKQRTLSLGRYPVIGLSEARGLRDEAKRQLLDGRDPALVRREKTDARLKKSKLTFEVLAREWHENRRPQWAKVHAQDVIHNLEHDIFPTIGKLPVSAIDAPMLVSVLRKIEAGAPSKPRNACDSEFQRCSNTQSRRAFMTRILLL